MLKISIAKTMGPFCMAIIVLFSTSCKNGPVRGKSKSVFTIKRPGFSCKVEESGLRLDADNKTQCAHFFSCERNPKTGYQIEAGQLKQVAAILLDADKMDISIETDKTANKFLNIDYRGETTKENNQEILQKILDHYNLKVIKNQKKVTVWVLNVKNKEKLEPYISGASADSGSRVEYSSNKIILKNASLKMLASQLKDTYGKRFSFNENDTGKYDLDLELKKNLEATITFLEHHYGIVINSGQQEIREYKIVDKTA